MEIFFKKLIKKCYTALSCQQILSWIVFTPNQTRRQLCLTQVYWQPVHTVLIPERMIALLLGLPGWKPLPRGSKKPSLPGSGQGSVKGEQEDAEELSQHFQASTGKVECIDCVHSRVEEARNSSSCACQKLVCSEQAR